MTIRSVEWAIEDGVGSERATVQLEPDRIRAQGRATNSDPRPYTVTYELETGPRFVTEALRVVARDGAGQRSLTLQRDASGSWVTMSEPGGVQVRPDLADALDCDLGRCPLTNSMPVLREGLLIRDGSADFTMAWVSVPDLAVRVSRQRYTTIGTDPDGLRRIRFESLDSAFMSDLTFDADGLVVDYPQLARRAGP